LWKLGGLKDPQGLENNIVICEKKNFFCLEGSVSHTMIQLDMYKLNKNQQTTKKASHFQ